MTGENSDMLSFFGSLLGAGGGILAAYLAVQWQKDSQAKAAEVTIRDLIKRLRASAVQLNATSETGSSAAARAAYRAFCAVRDVAIGVRTSNASVATIAARLEHTTVYKEIDRLINAPENGIVAIDARARAEEIISLCDDLIAYFIK